MPSFQEEMTFQVDEASAEMLRDLLEHTGVIIAGRRLFDITNGWDDHHPAAPAVVVVTHTPPEDAAALAEDDLRRRGRGGDRQGAGDRR